MREKHQSLYAQLRRARLREERASLNRTRGKKTCKPFARQPIWDDRWEHRPLLASSRRNWAGKWKRERAVGQEILDGDANQLALWMVE